GNATPETPPPAPPPRLSPRPAAATATVGAPPENPRAPAARARPSPPMPGHQPTLAAGRSDPESRASPAGSRRVGTLRSAGRPLDRWPSRSSNPEPSAPRPLARTDPSSPRTHTPGSTPPARWPAAQARRSAPNPSSSPPPRSPRQVTAVRAPHTRLGDSAIAIRSQHAQRSRSPRPSASRAPRPSPRLPPPLLLPVRTQGRGPPAS